MRTPTDFTTEQRDETVIQILNDAIIFERIFKGMQETVKAANPTCEDWDPIHFYNGFSNAWILLGINQLPEEVEEELKDELSEIFFNHFNPDFKEPFEDRQTSQVLAQHIYIDWKYSIDNREYKLKQA